MIRARAFALVLVAACSSGKGAGAPAALPAAFAKTLADAHLELAIPPGYRQVAPIDNPHWQYAFAMESADGAIEVRIRVDPLAGDLAEHDRCLHTPGCAGVDPNRKWRAWLMVIAANIAGGGPELPQVLDLGSTSAREGFGADAVGATMVPAVDPAFHARQHKAVMFILHKDDVADAVVAILTDNPTSPAAKQAMTLRFAR